MSSSAPPRAARLAQVARRGCVVVVCAIWVALWGIRQPVVWTIVGDSMAPHLLGTHLLWRCPDCKIEFASTMGEQGTPIVPSMWAAIVGGWDTDSTCPNCGRRRINVSHARPRSPDQGVVHPDCPARRFGLVAYRTKSGEAMAKRVLGLPKETVELRSGDVWINGKRVQKTISQFREVAVLVNDSRHRSVHAPRWRVEPKNEWQVSDSAWHCLRNGQLSYQHRMSYESPQPRTAPSPLRDNYGYNLFVSRNPKPVDDLLVEGRLKIGDGQKVRISLRSSTPSSRHSRALEQVTFWGKRKEDWIVWTVERPKRSEGEGPDAAEHIATRVEASDERTAATSAEGWHAFAAAALDGRAILAVDGREILQMTLPVAGEPSGPVGEIVRLSVEGRATGGRCSFAGLRIWRDLRYDAVLGRPSRWVLGANQWFLVGDNVPISTDCRETGPISRQDWIGVIEAAKMRRDKANY